MDGAGTSQNFRYDLVLFHVHWAPLLMHHGHQADSKHFLYTTSGDENNRIVIEVQYSDKVEKFSPEQIAGSLFGCLRRITQDALDGLV